MKRVLALVFTISALNGQTPTHPKPGLYAVIDTSEGTMRALLYERYTPRAVKTFVGLAQGTLAWRDPVTHLLVKKPFYNGMAFHRVVREEMIQAGDPTGVGNYNCGISIPDEFLPGLRFDIPGRLAIANTGEPDSGSCQFFITDQAVPRWNNHYTVFGQLVSGQDVEARINRRPVRAEKPIDKIRINSVTIERIR